MEPRNRQLHLLKSRHLLDSDRIEIVVSSVLHYQLCYQGRRVTVPYGDESCIIETDD